MHLPRERMHFLQQLKKFNLLKTMKAFTVSLKKFSTAGKMKNPILVTLILLLGIPLTESANDTDFKFGDSVAIERMCGGVTVYKHFAIYVGPSTGVDVGQGDNDIFHRTGKGCMVSVAKFDKLEDVAKTSKVSKDNYLDDDYKIQNKKDFEDHIKKGIEDTRGTRCIYRPVKNNCEHFATKIRYGEPHSQQVSDRLNFQVCLCFIFPSLALR
ncbi:phospholipase A and acyltransferase 3 [Etheostoma spectabile]|uniref:phospholipase A and acyltransferase 3 n=1 Tax=Etheostoma spectabile TaxID=54343 RepID=UPI0013AF2C75|nr:phospholipase A and acyltransferase 3-like [Etheostoma spectabile]